MPVIRINSMTHYSEYYNLDSIPEGWEKKEFVFVVKTLESFSKEKLLELIEKFEIEFSSSISHLEHEDLVSVLIDDVEKARLLRELKTLRRNGKIEDGNHQDSRLTRP